MAFNNTAATHTGVAIEEVVGCTLTDLGQGPFGSEMAQDLRLHLGQCVKNKKELGYTGRLAFIEGKWLQTHLYPVIDMDRRVTHVIGAAVDISAQKQIEKQLAENQAFLESLIDSAVCGLYVYDFKCKKDIQINRRYTEILGYSLDDLQRANDFMEFFHPDERDLVETHFAAVKSSRNGELLPLEYRFKHKLGHWVWCYSTEAIVALDADGEPRRLVGTFIDISERKKLIEQLQESNEYLERFAFAASHDLQEPLRKINAFSQSLAERLSTKALDGNSQFELQRLQDAANRMRLMIKELLSLSRINSQGIKPQVCSLLAILNQAREDLSLFLDEHSVSWQLPETDEQALIDPVLLRQVFQNLITNSVKFAKTGQAAKISVSFDYTANQTEIRFEDLGIGISQDGLKKIFDPFSRVHKRDDYPGSGIGLAIVQQIIRVHKGDIVCESELGQGTIFKIRLPRC